MVALKLVVFAAVVALAMGAEEERTKKDVVLGTMPYGYAGYGFHHYGYDDGKYFPGKYEKAYIAPAVHTVPAVPAVSTYHAAVPTVPIGYHPYNYNPYY